jgi:predicted PolB exonuclease-like 3'-5' exonuclease
MNQQQIQQIYNKGLDDAENNVINNFINLLNDKEHDIPFPNPKLEIVRKVIKERSDYYFKMADGQHGVAKGFQKKIENNKLELEKARA